MEFSDYQSNEAAVSTAALETLVVMQHPKFVEVKLPYKILEHWNTYCFKRERNMMKKRLVNGLLNRPDRD
jgi:hypothetical protein